MKFFISCVFAILLLSTFTQAGSVGASQYFKLASLSASFNESKDLNNTALFFDASGLHSLFSKSPGTNAVDSHDSDQESILPTEQRLRTFEFTHLKQSQPVYFLVTEFFAQSSIIKFYKNLIEPFSKEPWFYSASETSADKISGWKASNSIFVFLNGLSGDL